MDFAHALRTRSIEAVDEALRSMEAPTFPQLLSALVLYAEHNDPRYDIAASRFVARMVLDRRLDLVSARQLLDAFADLPRHPSREQAEIRRMLRY